MRIFLIWRGRAEGYKVQDEEWLKCMMIAKTMEWVSGKEVLIFDWTFSKAARMSEICMVKAERQPHHRRRISFRGSERHLFAVVRLPMITCPESFWDPHILVR
jgi:hypothetical protein